MAEAMNEPTELTVPDDWPTRAADGVVEFVDKVRSKTTRPAILVSRVLVYGIVIIFCALAMVTLLLVGLFRFTMLGGGEVYWRYFGWGTVLFLIGALLWSKRAKPAQT